MAFDVVETLFSLDAVGQALEAEGAGRGALEVFFGRLLRDGFARAATRRFAPFARIADEALAATALPVGPAARRRVLDAFSSLTAHGDARPVLDRLAAAALPVVALTNGSAETTGRLVRATGLEGLVGRVISVDEVDIWKPATAPYRHGRAAGRRTGAAGDGRRPRLGRPRRASSGAGGRVGLPPRGQLPRRSTRRWCAATTWWRSLTGLLALPDE